MENPVKLEQTEGIAIITLNRPSAYNSFDAEMVQLLAETLVKVALDPAVVGVVISGEGKAFCAGGNLAWVKGYGENLGAAFHELAARFHQGILEIRHMPKPVVAAINGFSAGGGFSLALACDFRIMETSATLKQGYTTNGLSIDGGGTYALPRLVGLARALEIAAFDEPISSEKAYAWGLATEVVDDGESVKRAIQMLEEMKTKSLTSFAASKKLITDSFNTTFEAQLEKERELLSWCGNQPNGREGIAAFLEKRKPVFNRP
ncbi:MAG: enoyl-CoA hydratase/isomerase family protein [Desulfobacteraceae bacterium]|nr:MAG: enoyl-CoA hydratase/isomerase family protein [Desulfobacteraceae bacterium]